MENAELGSLLADLESDRVERKSSLSDREKIRQAICAFANDLPNHQKAGVLFVGVHDDGRCAALPITDELLRALSDVRSDGNTVPFPSMTVQKRTLGGCEVAVVVVEPSDAPPVRYQGRVWVRIGPRRAVASPEEERRLTEKRRARDLPFDIRPVASATLDDLDLDLFCRTYLPASVAGDVLDQNQRSLEEQLTSLRLAAPNGLSTPTVLGILVTGKDPLQFLPGAYVQFLRVDGTGLADPVKDAAELSGPLPELLRAVEEKLQAHLETARDLTSGPTETAHPDYPMVALQQLTRNAILHRTYEGTAAPVRVSWFSDRIEILSPGGPYGLVNGNNFGRPGITDYRNPHLAEAMRNLGYVQKFGVGIALARQALLANANPPLDFRVEDTHVLAVIGRRD
jgi:ATP-dependent DNA helicase RecG